MKTQDLFNRFVKGKYEVKKIEIASCFIDKNAVYSYGYHFPLSVRLKDSNGKFIFLVNRDKYSRTTSKHQSWLNQELKGFEVIDANTEILKEVIAKGIATHDALLIEELGV